MGPERDLALTRRVIAMEVGTLARAITGERGAWESVLCADAAAIIELARAHGVAPLLAEALPADVSPDVAVARHLRETRRREAAEDLVRERHLRTLFVAFADADLPVVVFKGVDLAYGLYARPDLRVRTDTDLLVHPADRDRAAGVIEGAGWRRATEVGGDVLMYQTAFEHASTGRSPVDLHWRVANPQRFGAAFTFEELWREGQPRPELGTTVRGLSRVHALLVACVHRIAHHFDSTRLLWTHDIHALAESFGESDWRRVVREATARDVVAACRAGLERASSMFGTRVPAEVWAALTPIEPDARDRAFDAGARQASRVMSDLRHLSSWQERWRLVAQHAFPSSDYMRLVYAPASTAPLSWLYAVRIARGARRWMARHDHR